VQTIERTAFVHFLDTETLLDWTAVRAVRQQLHRLTQKGHTRLVVSFTGVQFISSDVLGVLAALQGKVKPAQGHVTLCGLDPFLRDMVRITHLDRVFEIYNDEVEALGLMAR
jgi:anti-anti-sigma factor